MTELMLEDIHAGYKGTDVLRGVSVSIAPGACVGILGPNGAGKSTLLRVITGQLRVRSGTRSIDGVDATRWPAYKIARAGVRWVGDPRPIYPGLTVTENLEIGGLTRRDAIDAQTKWVFELLPQLYDKRQAAAGSLSGGQQQMVAIGQALMSQPHYLCLDEPSFGLAPQVVTIVADLVSTLAENGVGIVWAEQFPQVALPRCVEAIILRSGSVVHAGPASGLTDEKLEAAYLGGSATA